MTRRLLLILVALSFAAVGCGDDEDDAGAGSAETQTAAATAPSRPASGCRDVEAPAAKQDAGREPPKRALDPAKTYAVVLRTSCGSFTIRLDQRTSPKTAASFVALARDGFFDGTVFHRIVPGFVIQGGDPTGTGTGGPGYSTRDVPPSDAAYTRGVVAMAKTANEPHGTSGSQFYVVTGPDAGLPPEYALLGKVVKGLGVTALIDAEGDPASGGAGTPLRPVVVEKATVRERG